MSKEYGRSGDVSGKDIRRGRLWFLFPLVFLPLLLGARTKEPEAPVKYREGFLEVASLDDVTQAECKDIVKMVKAAWEFDLSAMHWAPTKEMNRPLTLRLRSGKKKGVNASANWNGNRVTLYLDVVEDTKGALTVAHELGHIQAARVLGKHFNNVPLYFREGHGLIMNRLYADHLGVSTPTDWTGNIKAVMSMSSTEAKTVFADTSFGDPEKDFKNTFKMECMGVYFVEYMRSRYHEKGIPNMVPKMARVFELVGSGESYGQAFKDVYGVWANDVAADIVGLFESTKSHPAERCKGTRFEVAAQAVAAKAQ